MDFSSFSKPFYSKVRAEAGLRGIYAQHKVAAFFMNSAVAGKVDADYIYSDDAYRKWLTGENPVGADYWTMIESKFNAEYFAENVASKINDDKITDLFVAFGVKLPKGMEPDKFIFACALAEQLLELAKGKGTADNIVDKKYKEYQAPAEFSDYVNNSYAKYSKMKTLYYTAAEVPVDSFYVCNTISTERIRFMRRIKSDEKAIKNPTLDALRKEYFCTLIVGMGGCGKSMMMRHLFLESMKKYKDTGLLPIIVTLREFGEKKNRLFDIIVDSVKRHDISFSGVYLHKYLMEGRCQILLDGLDEIKPEDLEEFHNQLDVLVDTYSKNQFVMSTRKISSFISFSRFKVLWMEPFSHEQSIELVDKLEMGEEAKEHKIQFKRLLEEEYFKSHAEFAANPLLLTLMLMSFKRNSNVSDKKHIFYEEAYQTLLRRHDSDDKGYYKRHFHSVVEPSDFTKVFREFCAKSYRKGDINFDDLEFERHFESVHEKDRLPQDMMTLENFKKDAIESVCLLYEEELRYHFLHRSFQEYFFADYYSRADGGDLIKLEKWVREHKQSNFDDGNAFDMLYDLAPDKVEKFVFLPFMEYLFEDTDEKTEYWKFLKRGYQNFEYTILDKKRVPEEGVLFPERFSRSINEPSMLILTLMLNIRHIDPYFAIDTTGLKVNYKNLIDGYWYGEVFERRDGEKLVRPFGISRRILEEEGGGLPQFLGNAISDDKGKPIEIGHTYVFDFDLALNAREKYDDLIKCLEAPTCPAVYAFKEIKKYYCELKEKYGNSENQDDDDF